MICKTFDSYKAAIAVWRASDLLLGEFDEYPHTDDELKQPAPTLRRLAALKAALAHFGVKAPAQTLLGKIWKCWVIEESCRRGEIRRTGN